MTRDKGTSRPKIHKLPQDKIAQSELYVSRTVLIVCLALLLVAVIPALLSFRKVSSHKVAAGITPVQAQLIAPSGGGVAEGISVQDEKGQTVGQLAKMPADIEQGASIKSMSKVDSKSGKELMNIIGKY